MLKHRDVMKTFLQGCGIEIGALHQPSEIPEHCKIEYMDIMSNDLLQQTFPEISCAVNNKYIGNICTDSIHCITGRKFDFVIANHVIEHLPNPINSIHNMISGLNDGGVLVLSVPDKRNSYDKDRPSTDFNHILADYYLNTNIASDESVIDVLNHTNPDCFNTKEDFLVHFNSVKSRNDHIHVWTSDTFEEHVNKIFDLLGIGMETLHQSRCEENGIEYFGIFRLL